MIPILIFLSAFIGLYFTTQVIAIIRSAENTGASAQLGGNVAVACFGWAGLITMQSCYL